ncbi:DNA gyrase inhibitor YacG [Pseudotabrizicola sp. L79]|uniref:DNA gyrase inhibitor YacG n=1 Tax=Pseudotabrizicola sp. L79 TaxID=3118402 RepID=UPI002F9419F0
MTCPICAKASDPKYRPFCSRRCADIDLGRWLTESYVIPAQEAPDADTSEAPPEADETRH